MFIRFTGVSNKMRQLWCNCVGCRYGLTVQGGMYYIPPPAVVCSLVPAPPWRLGIKRGNSPGSPGSVGVRIALCLGGMYYIPPLAGHLFAFVEKPRRVLFRSVGDPNRGTARISSCYWESGFSCIGWYVLHTTPCCRAVVSLRHRGVWENAPFFVEIDTSDPDGSLVY